MARRKVQAPRVAEALQRLFPFVGGGLDLDLEETVVPVAIVGDASPQDISAGIKYAWSANVTGLTGVDFSAFRMVNPAGSGVTARIEDIQVQTAGALSITRFIGLPVGLGSFVPVGITPRKGFVRQRPEGSGGAPIIPRRFSACDLDEGDFLSSAPLEAWWQMAGGSFFGRTAERPNGEGGFLWELLPGTQIWAWISAANQLARFSVLWTETPILQG